MVRGMGTLERGFLLLADLTGYTAYLARGELQHAPVIAGDLLEAIVGRLEPPFRLAKFEGDAAFLFVEDGRAEPSLLFDAIQASYLAFRRRLRSIETATSCDCQACALAPRLDLKYFVHHGDFLRSSIAGRDELAGPEVIVAHRLLKVADSSAGEGSPADSDAADQRPAHGFALFTAPAIEALGLDPSLPSFTAGRASIEHLGDVATYTLDLEASWAIENERRRIDGRDGRQLFELDADIEAPPAEVWANLTSPALRPRWEGPIAFTESAPDGPRGIGTTTQCVTGRLATIEEIVDWQPFEHVGRRIAIPGLGSVDSSVDLEPAADRTHVRVRWACQTPDIDAALIERQRDEQQAALARLQRLLGRSLAVLG
jgi:hypothetical protein